jgi:LacI family transcriptional regulator
MARKRGETTQSPYVGHIVATLEARIRTGAYPGGRWLPTERELCSEFDVSRSTMRQALLELERNSLVVRSSGCRPLVRMGAAGSSGGHEAVVHRLESPATIGLCVKHDPKFSGTYLITQGVREAANAGAFRLIVGGPSGATLQQVAEQEARALTQMVEDNVSGIILWFSGDPTNVPMLQTVVDAGIPLIFVDRMPPEEIDADFVSIDNERAASQAVRYLIDKGHKRIAHVTNTEPVSAVYERMAGYRAALTAAGIPVDPDLILTGRVEGMAEEGLSASELVDRLLALPSRPTAVFAVTDFIALSLVRTLQERGIRVPEDIAIVGFDDLEQWLPLKPFLTTVRQPFERVGLEAVALIERHRDRKRAVHSRHVLLDAPLIARESA